MLGLFDLFFELQDLLLDLRDMGRGIGARGAADGRQVLLVSTKLLPGWAISGSLSIDVDQDFRRGRLLGFGLGLHQLGDHGVIVQFGLQLILLSHQHARSSMASCFIMASSEPLVFCFSNWARAEHRACSRRRQLFAGFLQLGLIRRACCVRAERRRG